MIVVAARAVAHFADGAAAAVVTGIAIGAVDGTTDNVAFNSTVGPHIGTVFRAIGASEVGVNADTGVVTKATVGIAPNVNAVHAGV